MRPPTRPHFCRSCHENRDLKRRVNAAVRVGDRRWNIRMDNGVYVRLPENDALEAWRRFARLERKHKLLKQDLLSIDLRIPDQLIVRDPGRAVPRKTERSATARERTPDELSRPSSLEPGDRLTVAKLRTGIIAALDIGSTKTCCFIAHANTEGGIRVIGIAQQASAGVRNGSVVDMDAAQNAVLTAVSARRGTGRRAYRPDFRKSLGREDVFADSGDRGLHRRARNR